MDYGPNPGRPCGSFRRRWRAIRPDDDRDHVNLWRAAATTPLWIRWQRIPLSIQSAVNAGALQVTIAILKIRDYENKQLRKTFSFCPPVILFLRFRCFGSGKSRP